MIYLNVFGKIKVYHYFYIVLDSLEKL